MASSISGSPTPTYLHMMVFVILILATALFLGGTAAAVAYRNRLIAAPSNSSSNPVSSRTDLEKGKPTRSGATCHSDIKPGTGLLGRFLGWRQRVLYESDSLPELALLPSYQPKESIWRKILNFLLRKKRVIPDPPTIVTITRVIEAAEARERAATATAAAAAAAAAVVVAKTDEQPAPPVQPPPPSFQIPAIIVQCWDTPAAHAFGNPFLPPSCSTASTSTSTSTSTSSASCVSSPGCRTPSSLASSSGSSLVLSPAVASPATFFFPGFPSASVSSFDYLHVPPPFWGGPTAEQVLADVSSVSGARFVLGPAPPPRAMLKSTSKGVAVGYGPPLACMAFAASAPVKRVEGERKVKRARNVRSVDGVLRAPQEGVVGIVAGGVPLERPGATATASGSSKAVSDRSRSRAGDSDDRQGSKGRGGNEEMSTEPGTLRTPGKHARLPRPDSDVPALLDRLPTSSSTTSSLVDLILEAIAAETDESFHYTTVSSSFNSSSSSSSSSRSSSTSTASSRSGASWASDEDEEGGMAAKTDRDGHRSFLMLEDESEEDFMDAVLSAYIRTDDEDSDSEIYSSNPSSGSDYGEFDDIDLCDSAPTPGKSAANVKGILPPRRKFVQAARVVHGFAI